ncbi:Crp/Fnr family transcriptional regulator [Sphingosinicella rhizophila]|uniref:Helix-turn-helix domain-containing protein n=1 Tax=Sphingosinicella rhizophila TaxID=3050082 RepID=A0ABU3QCK0_9SPHN|nr:cyclic nucleotide-binding domain-containing protein [Sphingosinicella sp. GR2756]MDT9600874.1 helix-turn-helix domain-containing protein [Sphingosinicella sp. GR2756]
MRSRSEEEDGTAIANRTAYPRGKRVSLIPADHACGLCPVRLQTFCGLLEAEDLARFKYQGSTGRLKPGEPLFHEGDAADLVYNLTAGTLKLYKLLPDGRRQIIGFLLPGDFLGTAPGDHAFSAEAVEPAEYCRFARARFDAFVDTHPEIGRELYLMAVHELAAAREQMVLLGRKTAAERLATFLLGLFDRARARNADWEIVRLPMSRTDIADYLGLTKETVSRSFTAFRTAGMIRLLPADRVELLQRGPLEELASANAG